jgi:hypothetical protein
MRATSTRRRKSTAFTIFGPSDGNPRTGFDTDPQRGGLTFMPC